MYKVAILGCENSHANSFLKHIIKDRAVTDVEVIGVYSDDPEAMKKLSDEFGVYQMKSYDEFAGVADGIIVTARHGGNHYKYAKPYIESGVPMFIDKPITVTEDDAIEFMRELKEKNIKVCGGSICVFAPFVKELSKNVSEKTYGDIYGGFVRAPINMNNPYGGFFFYTQHLAQIMTTIFGCYPKSVKMFENGAALTGVVRYEDYDVSINYADGTGIYCAGISCHDKFIASEFSYDGCFDDEFGEFYTILKGGEQPHSYEDLIAPVFIMNAMHRSLESGNEETINKISL